MSIQVMSDLHVEFGNKLPDIHSNAEVIILAGDTDVSPKYFSRTLQDLRKKTDASIITVLGNHEYYGHTFPDILNDYRQSIQHIKNAYLLGQDSIVIADYNFLGTTLWTDYDKEREIVVALKKMADFKYIYGITPDILVKEHAKSKNWLKRELRNLESSDNKTIIITHHVPSMSFASKNYTRNQLDGAFYANMDEIILDFNPYAWICGHTHGFIDDYIGQTRVVCNPLGYPGERTGYKQCFLIS